MNNSEQNPIKNPSKRTLKKISVIDPRLFVTYKVRIQKYGAGKEKSPRNGSSIMTAIQII
jgi:hypothetical protein